MKQKKKKNRKEKRERKNKEVIKGRKKIAPIGIEPGSNSDGRMKQNERGEK